MVLDRHACTSTANPDASRTEAEASAGRRHGLLPPWLPDLAAAAALVTFLYILFLYQGYTRLFRDSDAGWHIRSGESILAEGRLPRQDPYSFSRAGAPWMNWEWLSDVASGAAHRLAGPAGVAVLYAAAIAVAVWLWFQVHWRLGSNFWMAGALAVPLLGTTNLHWLARPHVWSWILMLAALLWVEGCAGANRRGAARLALYASLSALWANVHGSFLFAPLLALLYAASRLLRPLIWKLDPPSERKLAHYYLQAAGLSAVATLVNPYGWDLHRHVLSYLSDRQLLASIAEFQSFNFHAAGSGQILLALATAAAGAASALAYRRLDHFLLGAGMLALSLQSARGLPLVALLLLPIAGAHLSELWRRVSEDASVRPWLAGWLRGAWLYGERLRDLEAGARRWVVAVVVAVAAIGSGARLLAARAGFPEAEFPVRAAARLEALAPELFDGRGRLLAPDKYGGYLIYRFQGRLPVFFDGRSDFYGREFMRDYRRLVQVRPGWQDSMARFAFTHALLPNDYSLVAALETAGWSRLHGDPTATLWQRQAKSRGP